MLLGAEPGVGSPKGQGYNLGQATQAPSLCLEGKKEVQDPVATPGEGKWGGGGTPCLHDRCGGSELGGGGLVVLCTLGGDMRGGLVATVQDHGQRLAVVGFLERRVPTDQHVQDDSQAPDIGRKTESRRGTVIICLK